MNHGGDMLIIQLSLTFSLILMYFTQRKHK
jgi:hypothetical protein